MMVNRDSLQQSPWQQIESQLDISSTADEQTIYDAIIIGAGITGITTALRLQTNGKKCLLIDGHNIGFGTTGGTTAHINTFFDSTYPEIESDFGEEAAKLVAAAGKEAIELIKEYGDTFKIDCDLESKSGYLFSQDETQTEQLAEILKCATLAGVAVSEAEENGLPIPFERSLKFPNQFQFHPLKYILGLAKEFIKAGGKILENAFITEVEHKDGIHTAIAEKSTYKALHIIYATHIPPGINHFSFRCAPYRSYVLGLRLKNIDEYPTVMAYDMQEPYHYFRTHKVDGEQLLILGGADHKTGHDDPDKAYQELEDYANQYFNIKDVVYRWSSQYYVPVDGLPYIGRMSSSDDTIFVATGFNGNGMTWGTISGKLISDLILGNQNDYEDLFKPYRMKPIAGFTEFVKENADVAYHFITDRFKIEDIESLGELKREEGKVVEYNGQKIAVYKGSDGLITALHPTCTHAGCTVKFNEAEKSWDCPCHGGRFDLNGKVISGPPLKDLPPVDFTN